MSPDQEVMENPLFGVGFYDDMFGVADWTKSNLNSGSATFVATGVEGGAAKLDVGATTANHGGQAQYGAGMVKNTEGVDLFYETLVRFNTISTAPNALIGLAEIDTTLLGASGALGVDDCIGFKLNAADGKLDFVAVIGGSATTRADLFTPVDGEWLHLGFRVHSGRLAVPFINKVAYDGDSQIINGLSLMPDQILAPSYALTGAGTVRPTLDVDWVKVVSANMMSVRS
jgi:hypothetical protein